MATTETTPAIPNPLPEGLVVRNTATVVRPVTTVELAVRPILVPAQAPRSSQSTQTCAAPPMPTINVFLVSAVHKLATAGTRPTIAVQAVNLALVIAPQPLVMEGMGLVALDLATNNAPVGSAARLLYVHLSFPRMTLLTEARATVGQQLSIAQTLIASSSSVHAIPATPLLVHQP